MTEDIRRYELRKLKELVRKTKTEVHSILLGLDIWYYPSDLKRFLIWVQWSRRYHRPLKEIIERIVREYQRRRKREPNGHLGFKIFQLTGPRAEKFLDEEFSREGRNQDPKDVLELKSIRDPDLYFKKVTEIRGRSRETREEDLEEEDQNLEEPGKEETQEEPTGKPYRGSSRWRSPVPSETEIQSLDRVLLEFDLYPTLRKSRKLENTPFFERKPGKT